MTGVPVFMSIREMARTKIMCEAELRKRLAQNKLPGIYTGTTKKCFKIDVNAFYEMLKEESLANVISGGI